MRLGFTHHCSIELVYAGLASYTCYCWWPSSYALQLALLQQQMRMCGTVTVLSRHFQFTLTKLFATISTIHYTNTITTTVAGYMRAFPQLFAALASGEHDFLMLQHSLVIVLMRVHYRVLEHG
jgi:hypothetical protein